MFKGACLIAALFAVLNADHIVIPPPGLPRPDTPEKMLLFIPGGNVPNSHYRITASAIQKELAKSDIRLWAVIPSVTKNLCIIECSATAVCSPLKNSIEKAFALAVKAGWKRTNDKEQVFLAGHSLGGVCANTLMQAYSFPYAALLVFGSYVDKTGANDLVNYKTPVFTLNGELDGGQARPGKTSIWWRQFLALEGNNSTSALLKKPVIILPHLNHSDFCPGFPVPGDLMAEVTQAVATDTIGQFVSAFLANQILANPDPLHVALLKGGVEWTREFLAPYLAAESYTVDRSQTALGEGSSKLCAMAQHTIANLNKLSDSLLLVQDGFHKSSPNLEHCHPNYTRSDNNRLLVDTCSHTDYYPDIANTGSIEAASEVACKLLSRGRIAEQLKVPAPDAVACREVNRLVVAMAEQMAAPSTKARFESRGKGWCFLEDIETLGNIGPVWVFKDALKLKENSTCMTVASPRLHSAVDGKIYPGNTYCKFVTPERVLDWMMTDGLK